jgi:putative heme transporter
VARRCGRRGRKILRTVASAAVVAAAFGFALPHIASYRSVWASLQAMTWPYAVLIGVAAVASLASYWFLICAVLPSLPLREAAVVNLSSSAVANTLPAGGALGMGVSWAILSSWGISTADYVLYTLVSGIWNVFARLGLPVLALLVLMTATRPDAVLIAAAAVGLALLAALAAGLGLLLRSESFALRAGQMLQYAAARACRQAPSRIARSLADFRDRAAGLLAARGRRITVATVASNLILWLVLLACLRGTGLSQAQVPWQTSLAAFVFVRLLTVLPIAPGGLGISELGLVGILTASAGPRASAQVTAAVLLYRALTYLPPIPLGAATWLVWRHAPTLIHPTPATTAPASLRRCAHNGRQPHRVPAAMTTFRQPPLLTLPASGSGTARPGGLTIEYQRAGNSQVQYCDGILGPPKDCSSVPQPVRTGARRGPADPAWHDLSTRPSPRASNC